jgi:hypothetical protein
VAGQAAARSLPETHLAFSTGAIVMPKKSDLSNSSSVASGVVKTNAPPPPSAIASANAGLGVPIDGSLDSCRIIQGMSEALKRGEKGYIPGLASGMFI